MPRIPGPQDVGQARAPRDTGVRNAGAAGQAFADVGQTVFQVADQLRERRQQAEDVGFMAHVSSEAAKRDAQKFEELKTQATEGAEDFVGVVDSTLSEEHEKLLTEARAEQGFKPSQNALLKAKSHLSSLRGRMLVNAATYENNARVEKMGREVEATIQDIGVQAFNDPENLDAYIKQSKTLLEDASELLPAGQVAERKQNVEGEMAINAINGLITTQPALALRRLKDGDYDQYLDATAKNELLNKASVEAEEDILRGESQDITDSLVDKHTTLSDALSEAREIENPNLRDRTVKRLKIRFSEISAQRGAAAEANSEEAWSIAQQGGGVDDIPRGLWLSLPAKERISIQEHIEKTAGGKGIETDWGAYYKLTEMASNPAQQEDFASMNLYREHRNNLSNTEFKKLVGMQQEVRSKLRGDDFDETSLTDVRNTNQIVDDTLRAMDIDPSPEEGGKDAPKAREFRRLAQDEITQLERREKRQATAQEKQDIVDNLSMQFQSEGFFGFFADDEATIVDQVPAKFYDPIASALRRANVPVTGENIYRMYRDMKERGEID